MRSPASSSPLSACFTPSCSPLPSLKFAEAERTVAKEAGAVATLYRLSGGLDEETGSVFRQNLTDYSRAVINEDWPAMEQGRDSAHVREALDRAYATILGLRPTEQRGA